MSQGEYRKFSTERFAELLCSLERERSSAVIEIESSSGRAEISIARGMLRGAAYGNLSGEKALEAVLDLSDGRYLLHLLPQVPQPSEGAAGEDAPVPESMAEATSISEVMKRRRKAAPGASPSPDLRLGTRQVLTTSSAPPPGHEGTSAPAVAAPTVTGPSVAAPAVVVPAVAGASIAPVPAVEETAKKKGASVDPRVDPQHAPPAEARVRRVLGAPVRGIGRDRPTAGQPGAATGQRNSKQASQRPQPASQKETETDSSARGGFAPVRPEPAAAQSQAPALGTGTPSAPLLLDPKAAFLNTSISGTAPRFEPSSPPALPVTKASIVDEPVPSQRFGRATLEELEELNDAIHKSSPHNDPPSAEEPAVESSPHQVAQALPASMDRPPGFSPSSTLKSPKAAIELPRVGRYEVLARLKSGGMGSVYICRLSASAGFRRLFAMKVLNTDHLPLDSDQGEAALAEFFREAELLSKLHHPNIVGIVDVGTPAQPFLVLDYVEGGSLYELCQASPEGRDPRCIVSIMLDALSGIDAAHRAIDDRGERLNLVHCDLTPHNLLVGSDGACRVADFGIATQADKADGPMRGKPGYVAPERINGHSGDQRSDLFSLGVALYYSLTGIEPFAGATPEETLRNVTQAQVPEPSTVGFRPPSSLDWICMKALQKDPDERFQSAEEMMAHLRRLAASEDLMTSQSQVAKWVCEVLGDTLKARRRAAHRGDDSAEKRGASLPPLAGGVAENGLEHHGLPNDVAGPNSYAHGERTEYLPAMAEGQAASGFNPFAGLSKKRRMTVYASLGAIVFVLFLALFFPSALGSLFGMSEAEAPDAPREEKDDPKIEPPAGQDEPKARPELPTAPEPGDSTELDAEDTPIVIPDIEPAH